MRHFIGVLFWFLIASAAWAEPGTLCSSGKFGQKECIRPSHFVHDTCQAIVKFSDRNGLNPHFLARLLWQESRFDPNALSHANARGIAQFIDSTAALRGLKDSYNPAMAIEFSAQYLGELVRRFGNEGLAAVAYNGGERRAEGLIAGTGGLARETIDYVQIITGLTAETWRDEPPEAHDFTLQKDVPFDRACHDLALNRRLTAFKRPEPAIQPWGVQVGFGTTKAHAQKKIKSLPSACRAKVTKEKVDYLSEKSRASASGRYIIARIGRPDRNSAWTLCAELRKSGCHCAVYANK